MPVVESIARRLIAASGWDFSRCIIKVIPSRPAAFSRASEPLPQPIRTALAMLGIRELYRHQAKALDVFNRGGNLLLATPTASGKSLTYQLPTLRLLLESPQSKVLYLFPFKALARDQVKSLNSFYRLMSGTDAEIALPFDGDTTSSTRAKIRKNPPGVLVTNPDMLHYSLLPNHTKWKSFLEHVNLIVADEIHTYRGVFGSHVLQIFKRLQRILRFYGTHPRWIACSATIGNPEELVKNLFSEKFEIIHESGAPVREKGFLAYLPVDKASTEAVRMLRSCIRQKMKTIVFTKSRRQTELIYRYIAQKNPELTARLAVYRAGILPRERRIIENRLFNDELDAVVSTSALEVGIDIGGLDCCILVGFPGSVTSLWQRAGRVGRGVTPSLVVYIVGEDALDRYWFEHHEKLYETPVERVVVYNNNDIITDIHLECAADELPLIPGVNSDDSAYSMRRIADLVSRGVLLESASADTYISRNPHPQHRVSLRSIGESFKIVDNGDTLIGHLDGIRALKECHEGAIYLHGGRVYEVVSLDMKNFRVLVKPGPTDIYTQAVSEKDTEILTVDGGKTFPGASLAWGRLKITEKITGYKIKRIFSGETISCRELSLPEIVFETRGLWLMFPEAVMNAAKAKRLHSMGGIHAIEHALIGLFPLVSICDRNDLAGISKLHHPQTGTASVFVYDAFPGGLGLAESAIPEMEKLIGSTSRLIATCPCESGCPWCIQSPKCGSGNEPLDKSCAVFILDSTMNPEQHIQELDFKLYANNAESEKEHMNNKKSDFREKFGLPALPPQSECPDGTTIVFDIETQLSSDDVGGWKNVSMMKVALAVVYDEDLNRYEYYLESDVPSLIQRLKRAARVVGFNSINFDYKVLRGYEPLDEKDIHSLDILKEIKSILGHRLSLNQVASATLDVQKSADGLQSLEWWKQGKIDLIAEYCKRDVELTYRVYKFGKDNGFILYRHRSGMKVKIPVDW